MNLKTIWSLLKEAVVAAVDDNVPRLGAAVSFYTITALSPLFVIVIFIASLWFDKASVRAALFEQIGELLGKQGAEAIHSAVRTSLPHAQGLWASALAVGTLLVSATGLFIELQSDLNTIWRVERKPGRAVWSFVRDRLLSFAMVVGTGFLLLVSLVVSTALAALGNYFAARMPGLGLLWVVANPAVSFVVITVLFAMILKVLPDVKAAWRDVWIGAAVTALLFTVGKFLLGMYLGQSATVSAYGAAGSVVLILLWVYYSAQILFFGAELTKAYAKRCGRRPELKEYARWIEPPEQGLKPPATGFSHLP